MVTGEQTVSKATISHDFFDSSIGPKATFAGLDRSGNYALTGRIANGSLEVAAIDIRTGTSNPTTMPLDGSDISLGNISISNDDSTMFVPISDGNHVKLLVYSTGLGPGARTLVWIWAGVGAVAAVAVAVAVVIVLRKRRAAVVVGGGPGARTNSVSGVKHNATNEKSAAVQHPGRTNPGGFTTVTTPPRVPEPPRINMPHGNVTGMVPPPVMPGQSEPRHFCTTCGHKLEGRVVSFCPYCGARL